MNFETRNLKLETGGGNKKKLTLLIGITAGLINLILIYYWLYPGGKQTTPSVSSIQYPVSSSPFSSPTPRPRLATFSLSPANTTVSVNELLTLTLTLATEFELTGADAVLRFDPEMLAVEKVNAGQIFSLYPRLTYDNSSGQIIITGININPPDNPNLPNSPDFATLTLRAKQPGITKVQFDFNYDQTTGSTAVSATDAKNILSHVENAKIVIRDTTKNTGY